jgi:hypothetical protein
MFSPPRVNPTNRSVGRLVASRQKSGNVNRWEGSISASEPIVAMSFLCHGNDVYWAKSRKTMAAEIPICLLLTSEAEPTGLYVIWDIGHGQRQLRLGTPAETDLAASIERDLVVGEPFLFATVGPHVALLGLVLLRAQVHGRRNSLWALREEYLGALPPIWKEIMVHGRTGMCGIADGA